MKTRNFILLAIGCFILIASIVILYMWLNRFTIGETGTLGDGFNGLLAPFIGAAGAILIYMSFKEQKRANDLQVTANTILTAQWMEDRNSKIFDEIVTDYKKTFHTTVYHSGGTAIQTPPAENIYKLITGNVHTISERIDEFKKLEAVFVKLNFLLRNLSMMDKETQRYIWLKLDLFYSEEIEDNVMRYKKTTNRKVMRAMV